MLHSMTLAKKTVSFVVIRTFLLGTLMLGIGCTQKAAETSNLKISIPLMAKSNGAASADLNLHHLVINVSGPGISNKILYIWDRCRDCAAPVVAPVHNLDVPTGRDRLIQVLAVYQNSSTNLTNFFYGDKSAELSKLEEVVSIPVVDLTGGLPLVSGVIGGRYLDTTNSGPTGSVDVLYQPPNGRPALILEKGSIVNGWFSFFALKGIPLRYVTKEGRDIFGQALELSDRTLLMPSSKVAKTFIPVHTRSEMGTPRNEDEAQIHVMGYFGPGASADKVICRNFDGIPRSNEMFVRGSSVAVPSNGLGFAVISGAAPEPTNLTDISSPANTISIQGGIAANSGNCFTYQDTTSNFRANIYTNFLPLTPKNLRDGRDGAPGFYMPFGYVARQASVNHFEYQPQSRILIIDTVSGVKIGGKLLPGIASLVSGIQFFKMPASSDYLEDRDTLPCRELAQGQHGAVAAGSTPVSNVGDFFGVTNITSTETTDGYHAAVCFQTAEGLAENGAFIRNDYFGMGQVGGGPYLLLQGFYDYIRNGMAIRPLTKGKCYPASLESYVNNGLPYTRLAAVTANFTDTTNFKVYSSSGDCDTQSPGGLIANISLPSGTSSVSIHIRPEDSAASTASFPITLTTAEMTYSPTGLFSIGGPVIRTNLPETLMQNSCIPFRFQSFEADGVTPYIASGRTLGITSTGGTIENICAAGTVQTTVGMDAISQSLVLYLKTPATGSVTVTPSNSGGMANHVFESTTISTVPVSSIVASKVEILMDSVAISYGQCVRGRARLLNSANVPVIAENLIRVSLNAQNNGQFFDSASCNGPSIEFVEIDQGSFDATFWYRPSTDMGSLTITALADGLGANSSPTITVSAPPASKPYFTFTNIISVSNVSVVGTHELEGGDFLPVDISVLGTSFTCSKGAGISCQTQIDVANSKFKFHKNDIASNEQFHIDAISGLERTSFSFRTKDILNPELEVVECDGAAHSGSITSSNLVLGNNCLELSANLTVDAPVNLADKRIVGTRLSKNPVTVTYAGDALYTSLASDGGVYLANLNITVASGNTAIALANAGGTEVRLKSLILSFNGTAAGSKGISVSSNFPLRIYDLQVLALSSADGYAIYANNKSLAGHIKKVVMTVSGADPAFVGLFLGATSTASFLTSVQSFSYTGNGTGIKVVGVVPHLAQLQELRGIDISMSSGSGPALLMDGNVEISQARGFKLQTTSSNVIQMGSAGSTATITAYLYNGRLIGKGAVPIVEATSTFGQSSVTMNLHPRNVHFMSMQSAKPYAISSDVTTLNLNSGSPDPSSRICHEAGYVFGSSEISSNVAPSGNLPYLNNATTSTIAAGATSCQPL